MQVHELRKDGDAERLVRAAFDAATLSPAEKTIHTFVAVGGDHTATAGMSWSTCVACLSDTCITRRHCQRYAAAAVCTAACARLCKTGIYGTALVISLLMGAVSWCQHLKSCILLTPPLDPSTDGLLQS